MQPTVNSGTLIIAIRIWLAVSTSAVAGFALTAAQPNTRAVLLMGAGLVVVIGAVHPVPIHFLPIPPGS